MARVDPEKIRNIALLGHSHDGKTSLAEAMLYAGGTIDRLGRPESGNTTFDFEPEEIKRKISIGTAIAHLTWRDHKLNILDTPGFQDFIGDVIGALRAAEGALLVVNAGSGVVVGTDLGWELLRQRQVPTLVVVNKVDKENADFWKAVDSFKEFSPRPVAIQAPIGEEAGFKGVVDLLTRKAYEFDDHGRPKEIPIPDDMAAEVESRRSPLVEAAAEIDDTLLEKYLDTGELTDTEVTTALARGVAAGAIVPVLCAAAGKAIGIGTLLDAVVGLLPSPRQAPPVEAVNPRTDQPETLTADPAGPDLQDHRRSLCRPDQLRQSRIGHAHPWNPAGQRLQRPARTSGRHRISQRQNARTCDRSRGRRYRRHQQAAGVRYRRHAGRPRSSVAAAADPVPTPDLQRRGGRQEQGR
jgi:elongation factor G